ncbi:Thyroid adenoma-associated protein, variant 2 [Balamuthia mandrillaris]
MEEPSPPPPPPASSWDEENLLLPEGGWRGRGSGLQRVEGWIEAWQGGTSEEEAKGNAWSAREVLLGEEEDRKEGDDAEERLLRLLWRLSLIQKVYSLRADENHSSAALWLQKSLLQDERLLTSLVDKVTNENRMVSYAAGNALKAVLLITPASFGSSSQSQQSLRYLLDGLFMTTQQLNLDAIHFFHKLLKEVRKRENEDEEGSSGEEGDEEDKNEVLAVVLLRMIADRVHDLLQPFLLQDSYEQAVSLLGLVIQLLKFNTRLLQEDEMEEENLHKDDKRVSTLLLPFFSFCCSEEFVSSIQSFSLETSSSVLRSTLKLLYSLFSWLLNSGQKQQQYHSIHTAYGLKLSLILQQQETSSALSFFLTGSLDIDTIKLLQRNILLVLLKSLQLFTTYLQRDKRMLEETRQKEVQRRRVNICSMLTDLLQSLSASLEGPKPLLRQKLLQMFIEQDDALMEVLHCSLALCSVVRLFHGELVHNERDVKLLNLLQQEMEPHFLFFDLLAELGYDHSTLLDFLISNETCFLNYFVSYPFSLCFLVLVRVVLCFL